MIYSIRIVRYIEENLKNYGVIIENSRRRNGLNTRIGEDWIIRRTKLLSPHIGSAVKK